MFAARSHAEPIPLSQSVSVLLVDDNLFFRRGLQTLLDFYSSTGSFACRVVGQATSVEQALKLTMEQSPDLVLLDQHLGNGEGLRFLQARSQGQERVLVLGDLQKDEQVFRAMQAGAHGYVLKENLAERLWPAIKALMSDQVYLSPELTTGFFRSFQFYSDSPLMRAEASQLTEREQEVLHCLVQGASNGLIAQHLHITVATVKAHLTAIFDKLGVSSRTQAIVKALKLGLVSA